MAQIDPPTKVLGDLLETTRRRREESKIRLAGRQHAADILWMELHAHEPWVVLDLDNLHALVTITLADKRQASVGLLQRRDELGLDLVPVAVSFPDLGGGAVQRAELGPLSTGLE